jgi:threonine dehydratase
MLDRDAIRATAARIAPHIRRTPTINVDGADFGIPEVRLVFKLEFLQHAGSFKSRGAFNHMLTRKIPPVGVVAASGGNHGAAVAYAAMKTGHPATIFVPEVASPAKMDQIRGYGARLEVGGDRYADALAASEKWIEKTGAVAIHAYDQVETLQGQGTVGLEYEEQAPDLDALLAAVGGGGLISGIAAWYAGTIPIIGVEPELAPTLTRALEAGKPVDSPAGGIAADSLAPRQVGQLVFPIAQRYVTRTALVTDDAIRESQRMLWKTLRIVAEPGGAAALAALLSGAWKAKPGETIGVLLCGANTTAVSFA